MKLFVSFLKSSLNIFNKSLKISTKVNVWITARGDHSTNNIFVRDCHQTKKEVFWNVCRKYVLFILHFLFNFLWFWEPYFLYKYYGKDSVSIEKLKMKFFASVVCKNFVRRQEIWILKVFQRKNLIDIILKKFMKSIMQSWCLLLNRKTLHSIWH